MLRRKCSKCGKTRLCSAHREGQKSCKNYTRKVCRKCAKIDFQEWYSDPANRQHKLEYMRNYYAGLIDRTRKSRGPTR